MYNWSTLKKLIWLYAAKLKGGASAIIETITGNLPLVLQNAIQHSIKSLTRYGLCTQDGTPTPGAPVDIMCNNGALKWDSINQHIYTDGTPEVLTVSGQNLLNAATNITGKYITASGSISNGDDAQYTDLIPVTTGETYIWSLVSNRTKGGNNRWHGYDSSGNWVQQIASDASGQGLGLPFSLIATIPNGISYVRLSYGINDTEAMIEEFDVTHSIADKFYEGEMSSSKGRLRSLTEIQSPYTSSASIRCPATMYSVIPGRSYIVANNVPPATNVFTGFYASVDDVTNISNAVGGAKVASFVAPAGANYAVTVYLKYVSGTTYTFDKPMVSEVSTDYSPYVPQQTASVPMLLSVGDVKDEAEIISGLVTRRVTACLYDGTQDVGDTYLSTTGGKDIGAIIVYPLSTPTTEQITAQNLVTNEGTNIVDSVANVSPLEAEVKYMAASAQDVLSTLLGMKVTKQDISTQDAEDMIDIITGEDNK